jgi:hypothetical protein
MMLRAYLKQLSLGKRGNGHELPRIFTRQKPAKQAGMFPNIKYNTYPLLVTTGLSGVNGHNINE